MSIAEKVQQLESDRDSLHRSYQGKVDELKYVREQFDKYKADFGNLPREVQRLTADRDQWKARAEAAEVEKLKAIGEYGLALNHAGASDARVNQLECANSQLQRTIKNNLQVSDARIAELERENQRHAETIVNLQKEIQDVRSERDAATARAEQTESRCLNQINEIGELMDKVRERPSSTLEAVLEECRIAGIETHISVVDRQEFRVCVQRSGGVSRSTYAPDAAAAASAIESIVCSQDFYPDSGFARRRKPAETEAVTNEFRAAAEIEANCVVHAGSAATQPNPSETPNSSADPVAELLRRYPGEWATKKDKDYYARIYDGTGAKVADCEYATTAVAIAELVNRYRRIVEAVNNPSFIGWLKEYDNGYQYDPEWIAIRNALRPLVREAKG